MFSQEENDAGAADTDSVSELAARLPQAIDEHREQLDQALAALRADAERLAEQLARIPSGVAVAAPAEAPAPAGPVTAPPQPAPAARVAVVNDPFAAGSAPQGIPVGNQEAGSFAAMVLGAELAGDDAFGRAAGSLLDEMRAAEGTALTLCGRLLEFRGASAERMPQLLKEIGEAWYDWRGAAGGDPACDALVAYLGRSCAKAGIPNTIEQVRAGDRYDSKRHHARQPGVEVATVGGWIVLRDNGSVYTKASVTVR